MFTMHLKYGKNQQHSLDKISKIWKEKSLLKYLTNRKIRCKWNIVEKYQLMKKYRVSSVDIRYTLTKEIKNRNYVHMFLLDKPKRSSCMHFNYGDKQQVTYEINRIIGLLEKDNLDYKICKNKLENFSKLKRN
jgi:hypothetical protein